MGGESGTGVTLDELPDGERRRRPRKSSECDTRSLDESDECDDDDGFGVRPALACSALALEPETSESREVDELWEEMSPLLADGECVWGGPLVRLST